MRYLAIDQQQAQKLCIDFQTTTSEDSYRLALLLPDNSIQYIKANISEAYELPKGYSYLIRCGYKASGKISITFSDHVVKKTIVKKSGMEEQEILKQIKSYIKTGKETYNTKYFSSDGLDTNVQSLSYEEYKGIRWLKQYRKKNSSTIDLNGVTITALAKEVPHVRLLIMAVRKIKKVYG